MADRVEVDPTPIQRNAFDVAMELTDLYWRNSANADIEKIDSIFARFYATAKILQSTNYDLLRKYATDEFQR
ncbi:hypothetical protein GC096_03760 [Paenibacillus sp. LMG 31461]|uniref:Uncharacterized protein n=1 Tax=Paenibacillus plantarum TaxID=2654975 RepID=A0ABX1X423_9BACL|nr:hypothetical protein [Paenibacillus plantarum]NOU63162.1 hypothetical protein [Paenibacillus plantarum]